MMKKIFMFVFLIGIIAGCSGGQEASNSINAGSNRRKSIIRQVL